MFSGETIRVPPREQVLVCLVGLLGGCAVGWFAPYLADTFVSNVPLVGPLVNLIANLGASMRGAGRYLLSLVAGVLIAGLAYYLVKNLDTVTVGEDILYIHAGGDTKRRARHQVAKIVVEKSSFKTCVVSVRDEGDADLQRASIDFSPEAVGSLLKKYKWPTVIGG